MPLIWLPCKLKYVHVRRCQLDTGDPIVLVPTGLVVHLLAVAVYDYSHTAVFVAAYTFTCA